MTQILVLRGKRANFFFPISIWFADRLRNLDPCQQLRNYEKIFAEFPCVLRRRDYLVVLAIDERSIADSLSAASALFAYRTPFC